MKKLIYLCLICVVSFLFQSCENDDVIPKNAAKETTLEIQTLAKQDTNWYKVAYIDNTLYVLDSQYQVTHKLKNFSGGFYSVCLFLTIIFVISCIIIAAIKD